MTAQIKEAFDALVDKLYGWLDALILNLPNILVALIVFLTAYFIAQKLKKTINRLLAIRVTQESIRSLIASVSSVLIISLGLFLALGILNLDKALTSVLAGAGVAGLAIGLALQGTLANTFSGILLSVKDIMNVGDWVETNGYAGTVQEIKLRYIKLLEADNNLVIIPNKLVLDNPFKNYGLTTQIRATVKCGVGYESDLKKVRDLTIEAINDTFTVPEDKEIEFHYLEFGGSSINFQTRFWVDAQAKLTILETHSKAIMAIKEKFDQEGINIPFPIRTLQFDDKLKISQLNGTKSEKETV